MHLVDLSPLVTTFHGLPSMCGPMDAESVVRTNEQADKGPAKHLLWTKDTRRSSFGARVFAAWLRKQTGCTSRQAMDYLNESGARTKLSTIVKDLKKVARASPRKRRGVGHGESS